METKDKILEIAFKAFLDEGFDRISLNEIIKRTGMTKGAFYHHFKSKDLLLTELMNKYFHAFIGQGINQFTESDGTLFEKIDIAIDAIASIQKRVSIISPANTDTKAFLILLQQAIRMDETLKAEYIFSDQKAIGAMKVLLETGQMDKKIRNDMDAGVMAQLLNTVIKGTMFQNGMGNDETIDDVLRRNIYNMLKMFRSE